MAYEPSKEAVKAACKAICKSGKFETGQGTCALLCMDQLGDARRDCHHSLSIHGKLATAALIAAHEAENTAPREFTHDDVNILFEIMGDAINPNMNTAEIVQRTFDALEAVEAHRAKKG